MKPKTAFTGKVAVVTGAGQGIGLCIAQAFLQQGASVVIAEQNADLKPRAEAFLNAGDQRLFVPTDVASESSVEAMVEAAAEQFGGIDFLVNNAAILHDRRPLESLSYDRWQRVINANLSGVFLCVKHCKRRLQQRQGAIVNIASTRALMSEADTEAYSASKGGIIALTHALSVSLAPAVRVNCISPGWIVTDAYRHDRQKTPLSEADHAQHPAGRVGRPEDIADMVLYLCSEKAGFITGQNFTIDGGMTKKMIYVE